MQSNIKTNKLRYYAELHQDLTERGAAFHFHSNVLDENGEPKMIRKQRVEDKEEKESIGWLTVEESEIVWRPDKGKNNNKARRLSLLDLIRLLDDKGSRF